MQTADVLWPVEQFSELVTSWMAMTCGRPGRRPAATLEDAPAALADWIEAAVGDPACRVEHSHRSRAAREYLCRLQRPALIRMASDDKVAFAAVIGAERGKLRLLTCECEVVAVPAAAFLLMLQRWSQGATALSIEDWLERAGIPADRRARLRATLRPDGFAVDLWVLHDQHTFATELRDLRARGRLAAALGMHALCYVLWLASWALLGTAALRGQVELGWLTAWLLLIATWIWLRVVATSSMGRLAIDLGRVIKRRLLRSTLALNADAVRERGVGYFLGHVLESHSLETLALSGGTNALIGLVELCIAVLVLLAGAGGWWSVAALTMTLTFGVRFCIKLYRAETQLSDARAALTSGMVERMVGYRTRLAQEPSSMRHQAEDTELERYRTLLARTDGSLVLVHAFTPQLWLLLGLASLAPAVLLDADTAALAVGLGGVLIVYRSLQRVVTGASALVAARVAWLRISPLLGAVGAPSGGTDVSVAPGRNTHRLEIREIIYRHPTRARTAIDGWSLAIGPGERIWLDAPAGAGKSTLVSLLAAIRPVQSGLLLFAGLDCHALGARRWRRHVAAVPQFHENHVFNASLAFNLLLGRRWPPLRSDVQQAAEVCRELGLDEVIARMPNGFEQMLGESGWQLSHGERSRLFIARALLQQTELIVLDECLAGLDAQTIEKVLGCLARRAPSALLVAHS